MIRRKVFAVLTVVAAVASIERGLADGRAQHVVMICIDGLKPSVYTEPGPSKVPTLRRLAREGAYADGVTGVLPTVTFPSHTRSPMATWAGRCPTSGRYRLQPKADVFNVFNRTQFGAPNGSVTSAAFGTVSTQANSPREVQLDLKFYW